jgi:hypothetical protein
MHAAAFSSSQQPYVPVVLIHSLYREKVIPNNNEYNKQKVYILL